MAQTSSGRKETMNDWKIALLCSILYFFQIGVARTGSLFYVEFIHRYNINRYKASIPLAVFRLLAQISGPILGYLADHFQLRSIITFGSIISSVGIIACFWAEDIIFVTICWGILFGIGASAGFSLSLEIINRHFDKHLSTACGLWVAGASIGATVLPYVSKVLLDRYGLSGTLLILGGLFLNTVPLSLSLPVYPRTKESSRISNSDDRCQKEDQALNVQPEKIYSDSNVCIGSSVNEEKERTNRSTLFTSHKVACYTVNGPHKTDETSKAPKNAFFLSTFAIFLNPVFIVLAVIQCCLISIITFMNTMLIDYCIEKGTTFQEGVYVVMAVSVTDLVGRVGLGWITDYGFIGTVKFLTGSFIFLGLSCIWYIWVNDFVMCMVTSVLYGTMYGIVSSYSPKLMKDYIEPKDRTMAVASRSIFFLPIGIATPFILGYFKDTVKSYDGLMSVLGTVSFVAAVLTFSLPYLVKRQKSLHAEQRF